MNQREHIIREATKMFVIEGLKSIRMDDIATRLSVSKRTLYELFGDKETLIMECIMYNHKLVMDRVCEAAKAATNVLEEIMLMLQAWDHNIDSRNKLMLNLHKFYPAIHNRIVITEQEEGFPMFRDKLEKGAREGLIIESIDFDLTIKLFVGAVQGVMSPNNISYPKEISRINMFRHMMIFFIRSLTTEKGMKIIDKYIN